MIQISLSYRPRLYFFLGLLSFSSFLHAQSPGGVITNLELWLKADQQVYNNSGTTLATDMQNVQQWNDQSGNNNHFEQLTAGDKPTLIYNSANFNPGIDFDGTNRMRASDNASVSPTGELFLIGLFSPTTLSTNVNLLAKDVNDAYRWRLNSSTGNQWLKVYDTSGQNHSATTSTQAVVGTNHILSAAFDPSNQVTFGRDGATETVATSKTSIQDGGAPLILGALSESGTQGRYDGNIGEMIMYSGIPTTAEQNRIRTYLALKYGITLPHDFVSSGSTTVWSNGGGYDNDIAGIGRDDNSGLNQKQSRTENSDRIVTMGLGSIASDNGANGNSFTADESFLVWGNDDDDGDNVISELNTNIDGMLPCTRIDRTWLVSEVGSVGTVEVQFDISGLGLSGTTEEHFFLIIDRDGDNDFSTGTVDTVQATGFASNVITFVDVDFTDGNVFTLGEDLCSRKLATLAPTNSTTSAATNCSRGAYTYYYDAGNPNQLLFAINKNGNTFTATPSMTVTADPTIGSGIYKSTSDSAATYAMGRYWNVTINSGSIGSTVTIRFYYNPAELSILTDSANQWITDNGHSATHRVDSYWIKTNAVSYDPSSQLSAPGPTVAFTNLSSSATTGTENGLTYVEITGISSFSGGGPLVVADNPINMFPVEMLYFEGKVEGEGVALDWATASEFNASHFEVQRSVDGNIFEPIGEVMASGNSQQIRKYAFWDGDAPRMQSKRLYYRLKQIDMDGQFEFSQLVETRLSGFTTSISLYPNPTEDKIEIQLLSNEASISQLHVYSTDGRCMYSKRLTPTLQTNNWQIDVSTWPAGIYLIKGLSSQYESFSKSFIKE